MYHKSESYNVLRENFRRQSKQKSWETAKIVYELCKDKKYLSEFRNQEEFANYIGVAKTTISHYKKAYEYYLCYKNEIDIKRYSVEQVYNIYRAVGMHFRAFSKWLIENYGKFSIYDLDTYSITQMYYELYCDSIKR